MNLRLLLFGFLPLAMAVVLNEGKREANSKSKEKRDKIIGILDKKGSKTRNVKVKVQNTKGGIGIVLQVAEGGPLMSFEQKHGKPKGRKKCLFSGTDPEDPTSFIIVSQCKHFKAGAVEVDGEQFFVDIDTGELYDNVKKMNFTGQDDTTVVSSEEYERKWDAKLGDWVVEKVNEKMKSVEKVKPKRGKEKGKTENTRKYHQNGELFMQLGVYIDETLWKQFKQKYGDESAEPAVQEFVDYIVEFTAIHFSSDLTYPVRLALSKVEIWKTQPTSIPNTVGYDMPSFLDEVDRYLNPLDIGLDSIVVLTGLQLSGAACYAYTYIGDTHAGACSNSALAVVDTALTGLDRLAFMISHVLGHNLGMVHGRTFQGCYQDDIGPPFTTCSRMQFDTLVANIDNGGRNCLRDSFISEPVDLASYPGQCFPPQWQCQQKGPCYVHIDVEQTNKCDKLYCNTRGDPSVSNKWFSTVLSDGAYCGAGKICQNGQCVTLDTSLLPVHGGWSPTWVTDDENCDGACPDECKVVGQLKFKVEYRQCNNPYPKNGGKYCAGSISRSKVCGAVCGTGASTNDQYKNGICAAKSNERNENGYESFEHKEDCKLICWRTVAPNSYKGFYIYLHNGIQCGSGGRCVDDQCLVPCSNISDYYALQKSDCPPVDDMMQWQWQTKTGDGEYDGSDGDVQMVINGNVGSSEVMEPYTPHDNYERGAIDTFDLETRNIGQLTNIVVRMKTSTDGWMMEWCTLTLKSTGQVYNFTMNKRLDNDDPNEQNEYTLTPQ